MRAPRRLVCLIPRRGDDQFVSTAYDPKPPREITHCGVTFRLTQQRTAGGWFCYREP